jgi:excisionase family DNA binding protein
MTGYLTVKEAAAVLHMHYMSVYKMVQQHRLPAVKVGSRWKIDAEQLHLWLAGRAAEPGRWLLVGAAITALPAAAAGWQARLEPVAFEQLAAALEAPPETIVIDSRGDPQVALAALGLCRQTAPETWLVLLVSADPPPALVRDALALGPLTLLCPEAGRHPWERLAAGARQAARRGLAPAWSPAQPGG